MKSNNVIPSKVNNANTQDKEPVQPRSYLADLFKESDDPVQRQKDRDARFGRTSPNTDISGTFTK